LTNNGEQEANFLGLFVYPICMTNFTKIERQLIFTIFFLQSLFKENLQDCRVLSLFIEGAKNSTFVVIHA